MTFYDFLRAKLYFILIRKWLIYGLIIRKMKIALEMYDFFESSVYDFLMTFS